MQDVAAVPFKVIKLTGACCPQKGRGNQGREYDRQRHEEIQYFHRAALIEPAANAQCVHHHQQRTR